MLADKIRIFVDSAAGSAPWYAKMATRIEVAVKSVMLRPPSRKPNALPCSSCPPQLRMALIRADQNMSAADTPHKPYSTRHTSNGGILANTKPPSDETSSAVLIK
jgi:hypothetical protein